MSTAAKVKRLLELIELDNLGIQATDHGPFALVPLKRSIWAVYDKATKDEQYALYQQMQSIEHPVLISPITCEGFLAFLVTGFLYVGFHDGMGWAIKLPMFYTCGFLGLGDQKPNYKVIQRILREAGFEYELQPQKKADNHFPDDGSGDPEWVQRVHAEQRENFRAASGHDIPD